MKSVRQGDTGTRVRFQVKEEDPVTGKIGPLDISTADLSLSKLKIQKADGTPLTKTVAFDTDGVDGWVFYLSLATDFSVPDISYADFHVFLPGGDWHTQIDKFMVEGVLP